MELLTYEEVEDALSLSTFRAYNGYCTIIKGISIFFDKYKYNSDKEAFIFYRYKRITAIIYIK